jgi:ATP-binding cassette, subfamily B, bacterial
MKKARSSMSSDTVDRRAAPVDGLPPALSSMWRLCRLGYSFEPRMVLLVVLLTLVVGIPDALFALWLQLLGNAVTARDTTTIWIVLGLMAISATLTWLLTVVNARLTRRFRDRVTVALETHVATLQASVSGLEHQERSDYLDRLDVLRTQIFVLDHMYASVLNTLGWLVRLTITLALLASIHPALLLLGVFAVPTVVSSARRPAAERRVEERCAPHGRLAEHFFRLATGPDAGKEVRVTGIAPELAARRRQEWQRWFFPIARARWVTTASLSGAWAVFALAYVGAVVFVAAGLRAPVGSVLLILAAGAQLSAYVGATIGEIGFLRGIWMDGARRLAWLEDYARSFTANADVEVPSRLTRGIDLTRVSFSYPGTERLVLDDITLHVPPGSVVAIVGENGAGKSTLIKLLTKMYEPSSGQVLIDGQPLRRMPADEWRARVTGAFQDFYRFEFTAQRSVGLGDLPRLDDESAVSRAVDRAGATDVVERLPEGLQSQLGPTWPEGQELSFGQWQKLALSRGYMREEPLLMVLDEPTAALDAETEHALFASYAEAARSTTVGGITILVSHRFSTVRMADLIIVLDGSRLVEIGGHQELIRQGGLYAELFRLQANAYR